MAIGVYFSFTGLNAASYAECIKRLKQAGASHPAGRSYHSAFGPPDKLMVFDVWSSAAAFEKFGKTLMPILQSLNVQPNPPDMMPVHKVITPPPRAAAKRKSAPRKKK
jgi:hypothetical protein